MVFFLVLGALAICLGAGGDYFNFALTMSRHRAKREEGDGRCVSPIVLAPLLLNACGWMMVCLALQLAWFWFVVGLLFAVLLHLAGLGAWRR